MLGPNIAIHHEGYGCSEGLGGRPLNADDSGEFYFPARNVVEFLDVTDEQTIDKIVQAVHFPSLSKFL